MAKIIYLPLDERPCNIKYPQQLASISDLALTVPPLAMLGDKKEPAQAAPLMDWVLEQSQDADYLIISVDMLVFGGIVPSRLHTLSQDQCIGRLELLKRCKAANPRLRIYAFNLIMRSPAYNSCDEEPDYYALHGADIHRYGWLTDKEERGALSTDEASQFSEIKANIPGELLLDFTGRRQANAQVNSMSIRFVQENIIDHLVIPLDDNSLYGFTSMEQRRLLFQVEEWNLMDRVLIYPGADEIGCTLLARVFCAEKNYVPEAFVRYSSSQGPLIFPRYEDRTLNESIKSHLTAAGAFIADSSVEADFILMVNAPPVSQAEAAESNALYHERHRAYFSEVNLMEFSKAIHTYAGKGKLVALADVSVSNGADRTLMQLLNKLGQLSEISVYAGWNTSGNTIGTVVAHAVILSYYNRSHDMDWAMRSQRSQRFLLYRFLEDWAYQTVVRAEINTAKLLESNPILAKPAEDDEQRVCELITARLNAFHDRYLATLVAETYSIENVRLPWHRPFEVDFELRKLQS
ncbi:DUF4127 family protein [Paenibacillus sepulcri]|uniref:DUF4127 family protein n=1 Tax=Paenibacillus sepulcri TaxID=359917 RepID=A0ABS7C520_9BACL|nr:DUF4127 family protein [Paenibacillus sepulcri]